MEGYTEKTKAKTHNEWDVLEVLKQINNVI